MLRISLVVTLLLALLIGVYGRAMWQQTREPVVISAHPWPGYESLFLAEEFDWLPEGVILQRSNNATESIERLRQGVVDVAALTLDEALRLNDQGTPLKIIVVMDESIGADVVVAQHHVAGLEELAGMRIALEQSAVSSIVLENLLRKANLTQDQVHLILRTPDQQNYGWSFGNYDLAITYEPYATTLMQHGGKRLFDSRQFPGMIYDVLVVRDDLSWYQQMVVSDIVAAHFRALDYIRVNREDALRRIAAWRAVSYSDTQAIFSGLYLPGLDSNRDLLSPDGPMATAIDWIQSHLLQHSLPTTERDRIFDDQFLPVKP